MTPSGDEDCVSVGSFLNRLFRICKRAIVWYDAPLRTACRCGPVVWMIPATLTTYVSD